MLNGNNSYFLAAIRDVRLDKHGNIYVFDAVNPRVLKFDENGNFLGLVLGRKKNRNEVRKKLSGGVSVSPAIAKLPDSVKTRLWHKLNNNKLSKGLSQRFKREILIRFGHMSFPFEMEHYQGSKYLISSMAWYSQVMENQKTQRNFFHIYNLKTNQVLSSFGNSKVLLNALHYNKGAAAFTSTHPGDVLFTDRNTMLFAPYVYNGTMLVFKKTSSGKWKYASKIKGKNWERPAYMSVSTKQTSPNSQKSGPKTARNIIVQYGPSEHFTGFLNIHSAGLFQLNENKIVHFSVGGFKSKSDSSFYQKLYAEVFNNDLNYLGSKMIKKGKPCVYITDISTRGKGNHFFMVIKPSNLHSNVIEFSMEAPQ